MKKNSVFGRRNLVWLSLFILCCSVPILARSQTPVTREMRSGPHDKSGAGVSASAQQTDQQPSGSISGKVVDQSGASIPGATVKLKLVREDQNQEVLSDDDGQFSFDGIAPGPFQITFMSAGLAAQTLVGTLHPGEAYVVPLVMLAVASQTVEVQVIVSQAELAQEEIKEQEKQRVLGFIPNFYVSYVPDAAPLPPRLKFGLAWKSASDPITIVGVGVLAGINQAANRWSAYGQGAQGYAKRYGAAYADVFTATFLGGAVLPSVLKQDPRYFYKGTGSKRSRVLYAVANAVICRGDDGKWQPNYSEVLGSFAAAGIANLYYPAKDRRGAGLVVSTAMIRLGEVSLAAVLQEFVFPKLTPHRSSRAQAQP
jgi:hypothetical protein